MRTSALAIAAEMKDSGASCLTLPTNFPTLNKILGGGLMPGRMYLLMARTEVGKTTLSLNLAAAQMQQATPVAPTLDTTDAAMSVPKVNLSGIAIAESEKPMSANAPTEIWNPQVSARTTLAGTAAISAASPVVPDPKAGIAIASLEMTRSEVLTRTLSILSRKSPEEVEQELRLNGPDPLTTQHFSALSRLHIWDEPGVGWDELGLWIDEVNSTAQEPVKLMVLDHLQLLGGYHRSRIEKVKDAAKDAKIFAKQKDVALVVIHQTHRMAGEGRPDHGDVPVTLESGEYGGEQDADVALGMFRPERNPDLTPNKAAEYRDKAYLQVLKNRFGKSLKEGIVLRWVKPSMAFEEVPLDMGGLA